MTMIQSCSWVVFQHRVMLLCGMTCQSPYTHSWTSLLSPIIKTRKTLHLKRYSKSTRWILSEYFLTLKGQSAFENHKIIKSACADPMTLFILNTDSRSPHGLNSHNTDFMYSKNTRIQQCKENSSFFRSSRSLFHFKTFLVALNLHSGLRVLRAPPRLLQAQDLQQHLLMSDCNQSKWRP